jgi:hypothetical protein
MRQGEGEGHELKTGGQEYAREEHTTRIHAAHEHKERVHAAQEEHTCSGPKQRITAAAALKQVCCSRRSSALHLA